uniref:UPAR/Ly6 domain-containing protein n=1 Tax=Macrostomum lignano TaxID=282301 RepID=A0A1I8HP57_9PLAT
MSRALLLLALGASILATDARKCYTCSKCSDNFEKKYVYEESGCSLCAKYKYADSDSVSRICASMCVSGTDTSGNRIYCCSNKDYCNSTGLLRSSCLLLLLLLLAALAVFCSQL